MVDVSTEFGCLLLLQSNPRSTTDNITIGGKAMANISAMVEGFRMVLLTRGMGGRSRLRRLLCSKYGANACVRVVLGMMTVDMFDPLRGLVGGTGGGIQSVPFHTRIPTANERNGPQILSLLN